MTPERYSLSNLQKAITHPELFSVELANLYNKAQTKLTYRLFYNNWMTHSCLSGEYKFSSCKNESRFAIRNERENEIPDYFQDFISEYAPPPRIVYKIDHGYLCGSQAIPFNASQHPICTRTINGAYFMKSKKSHFCSNSLGSHFRLKTPRMPLNESVIFPLIGIWDTNYFHWVTEYLPKLRGLKIYEKETGERPKVLLTNSPHDWQLEWLKLLNIDDQRCVTWDDGISKVETLILTDHRMQTGGHYNAFDISLDDMCWVRDRALSAIPQESTSPNKVYISRQGTRRKVSNFVDIKKVLQQHDYAIYRLEELSVSDQVSLLSTADYIAGPHGAGLVNILFGPDDATIVELLPKAYNNPHYFRLSQVLNQDYHCLISDITSKDGFYIDPIEFSNKLSQLQSE